MSKISIVIYTDGSCSNNGYNNAQGGIGVYFPNKELPHVSKIFDLDNPTNQRTELYAILVAIKYIHSKLNLKKYNLLIKSDSTYSINCITKWVNNWINNGWKNREGKDVANRDLIEPIYEYYLKYDIKFEHVAAHTKGDDEDSIYNAKVDKLATKATQKAKDKKIESSNENYNISLIDNKKSNRSKKSNGSKKSNNMSRSLTKSYNKPDEKYIHNLVTNYYDNNKIKESSISNKSYSSEFRKSNRIYSSEYDIELLN